jgi:hypothetical protein
MEKNVTRNHRNSNKLKYFILVKYCNIENIQCLMGCMETRHLIHC